MSQIRILFTVVFMALTLSQVDAETNVQHTVDASTLTGKVMCGYQGWFNCESDGAGRGWRHWGRGRSFGPGNVTVDLWPDMSEAEADERYPTAFRHADGSVAHVFSSANGKTVMRHFQWMYDYGIDGAFVQRFATGLRDPVSIRSNDIVLGHARDGAKEHGRAFAVMYDLSSMRDGSLGRVIEDWRRLQTKLKITDSEGYLHHKGKPLVAVWGVGFRDRHEPGRYTLQDCRALIVALRKAGCSVMLGVPTGWREQDRDCVSDPDLPAILSMADVISPWTVGRYRTPKEAARHGDRFWQPDQEFCVKKTQDYLPVVYPGFSWHNLENRTTPLGQIPRLKGEFLWSQIVAAKRAGSQMIYVAMFDEVDEATAIFKCTNNPPVGEGVRFLTNDGLPSDHYLKLVGNGGKLLRGELPLTGAMPSAFVLPRKAEPPARDAVTPKVTASKTKPNVVFIISDDQSWDSFGFMGGKVHTPRLDKMVERGLYLSNFNVTSTVCSPSRYSFLTGRFAGRCEGEKFMREHPPGEQTQVENIGELEPHRWNLAKVLQDNGYRTGFVGKSHVVRHDLIHTNRTSGTSGFMGWPQNADPRDPAVNRLMKANHQMWCKEIEQYGFDRADGVYAANLKELHCDALNVHNLDWTIDSAVEFLDESKLDAAPFFLYVSTTLHHGPAPWVNRNSLDADPRMTGEGYVAEGFDVLPDRADVLRRNREAGFQDKAAYALWLDDGVGAILDKIKALGIEKETLVVFVPDHGAYRHGKTTLHEYGMRVPMLCVWPGTIKPGLRHDGIVANIDFAPTVMDVCGIRPPKDYQFDGVSFQSILRGDDTPVREVLFSEMGHSRAVKTKDWKYIAIRYPEPVQRKIDKGIKFRAFADHPPLDRPYLTRNGHLGHHAAAANPHYFEPDQLYRLGSDPEENDNVVDQHPEVLARMKRHLAEALQEFEGRPFGEFTK